jgi:N-acylneuraminate cytidylyltransferase
MDLQRTLFVITARGGSKGIPQKNIKPLGGKPLIQYSIDVARQFVSDEHICVSTDSEQIKSIVEAYQLPVPFIRPADLATDQAGSYEVLLHAVDFYKQKGISYDTLVLLQPTSPFRKAHHVKEALALYESRLDMVVAVAHSELNPYFNLFEETAEGLLVKSKPSGYVRRQDCPPAYNYNGAIYIININSLQKTTLGAFQRVRKYEMDALSSIDLDSMVDWMWAEFILEKKLIELS